MIKVLRFRPLFGDEFPLEFSLPETNKLTTIEVVHTLSERLNIHPAQVKLILQGKTLQDDQELIGMNFNESTVIDILVKEKEAWPGGERERIPYKPPPPKPQKV